MNTLELLKEKLVMLASLIAKTTDEKEQKEYIAQRDEVNIEIGKETARLEAEDKAEKEKALVAEKDLKDAANKSVMTKATPKIIVGTPDNYKGVNIKSVVGNIDVIEGVSPVMKAGFKARPEKAEGLIKHFADLMDNAKNVTGMHKAMQEGTDSEGGYLTPTEQRAELLAYIREMSVVAGDCTHISMSSDVMTLPRELTNVTVAWTAEESDATDTTPSFDQVTLTAARLDASSTSSNELIQDTNVPGGITAVLLSQFTEAVAKEVDKQILVGTGSPISGVFTSEAGYSEVFESGSTAFSEILESNIRGLIAQIQPERLDGAKWYMHNSVLWNHMYGLKDTQGRPLFVPSLAQSVPGTLYGYPAVQSTQATSTSAAGATMAAFGNLKGFYIGDRLTNISLFVDPYTKGVSYQTNFYMFTRWAFAHALSNYYGRIVTAAS